MNSEQPPWPVPCIILAGGFGTRLRHVLPDLPKPLAPINGVAFLDFLIMDLARQGIKQVILATGYKSELIKQRLGILKYGLDIQYSQEIEPLGTGGAIRLALKYAHSKQVLILNGDSYCPLPLKLFVEKSIKKYKPIHIALTYLADAGRYGLVQKNTKDEIVKFTEKVPGTSGLINVGIYCIQKTYFIKHAPQGAFSIEKDFFPNLTNQKLVAGHEFMNYFIDIGVQEDFERANRELPARPEPQKITKTLFLDRDGVINKYLPGDYVKTIKEFKFRRGVLPALKYLASLFDFIFITTNQQGVGKGIMSEQDLEHIHDHMVKKIISQGGKINHIFYCTALKEELNYCRKPNPGMIIQAQNIFPEVDLRYAFMVGDSEADLEMGKRLGLKTVWIRNRWTNAKQIKQLAPDEIATSLWAWAQKQSADLPPTVPK